MAGACSGFVDASPDPAARPAQPPRDRRHAAQCARGESIGGGYRSLRLAGRRRFRGSRHGDRGSAGVEDRIVFRRCYGCHERALRRDAGSRGAGRAELLARLRRGRRCYSGRRCDRARRFGQRLRCWLRRSRRGNGRRGWYGSRRDGLRMRRGQACAHDADARSQPRIEQRVTQRERIAAPFCSARRRVGRRTQGAFERDRCGRLRRCGLELFALVRAAQRQTRRRGQALRGVGIEVVDRHYAR